MRTTPLRQPRWRRGGALFSLAVLLGVLGLHAQQKPKTLVLLQQIPLPPAHSVPTDIRWASDSSVYISWDRDGVAEVGLDGTKRHLPVPDLKTLNGGARGGINHYRHLAVSPTTLTVASPNWGVVWRPIQANPDGTVNFQSRKLPLAQDLDVSGDRILWMGNVEDQDEEVFAAKGDVAWVGTLSSKIADLKPVLYDLGGAGAPNYFNCRTHTVGAVRFLADGSFLLVPGFQDGIHLYDAAGRQVRTWTNQQVGIDTHPDCPKMSKEEANKFAVDEIVWQTWLNRHHVVDDILPLPQGPGLLVRSWGPDGQAHWTLKVLQAGTITTYTVPLTGHRPSDRLQGDVRNGKIVLLSSSGLPWSLEPVNFPAEVAVLALPNA